MSTQLGLDGMPRRLFTATPTKLTTWLDCPNRYRLTYVDKAPKGPPWAHNSVGNSVHNTLREWFTLDADQRTVPRATALLRGAWITDGFRDTAQSDEWRERAVRMVERYVRGVDPTIEPLGVERTVAFRTETLAVNGRADRIDLRPSGEPAGDDELVVVDYKTGRQLLSTADARSSLALAVYAIAAERTLRRRCRRVELHHLPSGTVIAWEHDDRSLRRHLDRAEDIANDAREAEELARARRADAGDDQADVSEVFPARPGPLCGYCDVLRSCSAGIAETNGVVPAPWSVLDKWSSEVNEGADDEVGSAAEVTSTP